MHSSLLRRLPSGVRHCISSLMYTSLLRSKQVFGSKVDDSRPLNGLALVLLTLVSGGMNEEVFMLTVGKT